MTKENPSKNCEENENKKTVRQIVEQFRREAIDDKKLDEYDRVYDKVWLAVEKALFIGIKLGEKSKASQLLDEFIKKRIQLIQKHVTCARGKPYHRRSCETQMLDEEGEFISSQRKKLASLSAKDDDEKWTNTNLNLG